MTPDEIDAETRKYSNDAIILLRLKSGKIAMFNNSRELLAIVDRFPSEIMRQLRLSRTAGQPMPSNNGFARPRL